jgi:hypothetical protein
MNSLELLLLLTFVIVLYMVLIKNMNSNILAGGAVLWFVILWIGFDNMGAWDTNDVNGLKCHGSKVHRLQQHPETHNEFQQNEVTNIGLETVATEPFDDGKNPESNDLKEKTITRKIENALKTPKSNKSNANNTNRIKTNTIAENIIQGPMPTVYSEENYKYNLFDELGCLGDNLLAHKMKQMSNKNREAMDNFSRTYTKYANINYFEQELKDSAASCGWWDDDANLSTKF